MSRLALWLIVALFTLAACAQPPAEPTPEPPCCTADMLIELHKQGLKDEAILAKVTEGAGPVVPRLREAGVAEAVIEGWVGMNEPEPTPQPTPAAKVAEAPSGTATDAPPPKAKGLPITMRYETGKNGFELVNMGDADLTNLKITLNDEFQYTLPVPLKPNSPDSIRLASHRSTKTGDRMHDPAAPPFVKAEPVTKIYVKCDQGSWSKRF